MNVHCLRTYVDHLQERSSLTVGTIAEKIRRLKLCVEYAMFLHEDERTVQRCTRVLQQLTKWRCSLHKEIRQRKGETRVKSKAEVAQSFLNSLKVQEQVKQALQSSIVSSCSPQQFKFILAYVSAHMIYRNAQRTGVVQYMNMRTRKSMKRVSF